MTEQPPAQSDPEFERALLRADICAGNTEAAQMQYERVRRMVALCPECSSEGEPGSICQHPEPIGDRYRVIL